MTLTNAAEIGEYFTVHAQAAYDAIGADPAVSDARALLDWARNTGTQRFKASEVLASLRHRFKKIPDLDPALRVLESHGWIRRLPAPPSTRRGRPVAPIFEVHPEATP
jgi:replicative DNA helicase